jgi:hypothetical protein
MIEFGYSREDVAAGLRRLLFTDPITVAAMLRRDEMIIRGAGKKEFVFTPVGVDQTLLRQASFTDIEAEESLPTSPPSPAPGPPPGPARADHGQRHPDRRRRGVPQGNLGAGRGVSRGRYSARRI